MRALHEQDDRCLKFEHAFCQLGGKSIPVFPRGAGGRGPLIVNNAVPNVVRQPAAERWQLYLHSAFWKNAPPREWSAKTVTMGKAIHKSLDKLKLRQLRKNQYT